MSCQRQSIIWNAPRQLSRKSGWQIPSGCMACWRERSGGWARSIWRVTQPSEALVITAKATPVNFNVLEGYAGIAEVYLNLWKGNAAFAPAARKAIKQLSHFAHIFPIGEARALLAQGRAAWLSGKHDTARALWQKGLAAAEQRQVPYDLGLLMETIGRHAPPGDAAREEHLRQLCRFFRICAPLTISIEPDRSSGERHLPQRHS